MSSADPKPWQRFAAGVTCSSSTPFVLHPTGAVGTASGAALVLVGHPLDTLKVKLQVGLFAQMRDIIRGLGVVFAAATGT